jgi:hypothetical protein
MPLKRQTLGAQSVIHRLAIAVRQKLSEMAATNGTFHFVAEIKRTDQKAEQIAQLDEPLAGKNPREKGNQFLHQIIAIDSAKIRKESLSLQKK